MTPEMASRLMLPRIDCTTPCLILLKVAWTNLGWRICFVSSFSPELPLLKFCFVETGERLTTPSTQSFCWPYSKKGNSDPSAIWRKPLSALSEEQARPVEGEWTRRC